MDEKTRKTNKRWKIILGSIGAFLIAVVGVLSNLTQVFDWLGIHPDKQSSSVAEYPAESVAQTETEPSLLMTDTLPNTDLSVTETAAPEPPTPQIIKLSSLDYYYSTSRNGMFHIQTTQKDNVGNEYSQALICGDSYPSSSDERYEGNYTDYYLNKKYSKLTGTVFITDLRRDYDGRPVTFAIYCDDMQVYSLEMKDNLPQQFEIDVSDCESMRIQIDNIPTEFSGYEMTDNLIGLSAELETK